MNRAAIGPACQIFGLISHNLGRRPGRHATRQCRHSVPMIAWIVGMSVMRRMELVKGLE